MLYFSFIFSSIAVCLPLWPPRCTVRVTHHHQECRLLRRFICVAPHPQGHTTSWVIGFGAADACTTEGAHTCHKRSDNAGRCSGHQGRSLHGAVPAEGSITIPILLRFTNDAAQWAGDTGEYGQWDNNKSRVSTSRA